MLTLADNGVSSRRDFLRAGAFGLSGLTLPWWLAQKAKAAEAGRYDYVRDKAIVLLFCCGGPSQFETFDPHMEAPSPARSLTGEIKTTIPGVTFGSTFKGLAKRAKQLAVVRNYAPHNISDHAKAIKHVLTAGNALGMEAGQGAIHTRLHGRSYTDHGIPVFTRLIQDEVEDEYMQDRIRMRSGNKAGALGPSNAPFDPLGGGVLNDDLKLNLPFARLNDRRALVDSFDELNRKVDQHSQSAAIGRHRQQALDMILGGKTREALDLNKEDPRLVERYDTSHMRSGWLKKRPSTIGKRLLMARRLAEAGCRFITVGMAGWDNHGNRKHPGVVKGMEVLGRPLDHAVSAFLDDVKARGLSDKILLVITGEFGRTVKIQAKGGRDHWPSLGTLVFAGGGLKMGQTIGASEKLTNIPKGEPYKLDHLTGTLLHTIFDIGQMRFEPSIPGDLINFASHVQPIRELM